MVKSTTKRNKKINYTTKGRKMKNNTVSKIHYNHRGSVRCLIPAKTREELGIERGDSASFEIVDGKLLVTIIKPDQQE